MAWLRMDDRVRTHPKIVKAGPLAGWLWFCGVCYCREHLTDGVIQDGMIPTLAPGLTSAKKHAQTLVDVGLWHRTEGGYHVHDFLDWNPSRTEIETNRAKDSRRKHTGVQTESERNPDGIHQDASRACAGVRARAITLGVDLDSSEGDARGRSAPALAGSLPRDHLTHGFCGTRFCVTAKMTADMVRRFGDEGETAVQIWLQSLNDGIGPHESAGGPVWVLQQFDAFLVASGRVSAPVSGRMTEAERKRADWDAYKRKVRAAEGGARDRD